MRARAPKAAMLTPTASAEVRDVEWELLELAAADAEVDSDVAVELVDEEVRVAMDVAGTAVLVAGLSEMYDFDVVCDGTFELVVDRSVLDLDAKE